MPLDRCTAFYAFVSVFTLLPSTASALDCFEVTGNASALASDPAAAHSTALPVTLATSFRVSNRCTYGLSPDPARMERVPEGETDFGSLAARLAAAAHADPSARPRTLYGRTVANATSAFESVFRESCTEALVSDRASFDAHVDTATGALVVARRVPPPGTDCGAGHTVLRFVPVHGPAGPTPGLSSVTAPFTLDAAGRSVALGTGGDFAVYGSRTAAAPGLLVGHVGHSDPLTALRQGLASESVHPTPWFRARWSSSGDFELGQSEGLREQGDVWPEIVTAASANELWLADAPTGAMSAHAPRMYGPVRVGPGGDSVVLPPDLVTEAMTRRYGPAGRAIVPTLDEWDALRRGLQVCLIDRYAPQRPEAIAHVPDGSRCARLAHIAAPVALASLDPVSTPRQVCLHRTRWEMSVRGATAGPPLADVCIPLPTSARSEDAPVDSAPVPTAMVGDRMDPQGTSTDLFACIDNHCRPLREITAIWQPGLVSIRSATSVEAADHAEGVSLTRFVAIDPVAGWLPVGLYTGGPIQAVNPWASLDHDEPAIFSFVRRRQALTFRLASTPTAAAVWNAHSLAVGQGPVLTDALPVVGGMSGSPAAPPPSGLVVLVSRDDRCPLDPSVAVRAIPPVDPDALLVDQRFHVFLARTTDDAMPYECVAHATFRVRESRAIGPLPWLHLGLWGDTQVAVFLSNPTALGVIQPLGYAHARLPWGFNAEAAVDLTAAVTFANADTSRAGAGISVALGWGPENVLPRLLSLGAMLNLATGTAVNNPILSPYIALDLSTLIDLAGGR